MPIKAVQQFMLGTVLSNENEARQTLAAMKAAGYDGIELCGFMIHPIGFMVRLLTKAAGMPVGKGGNLDWHALVKEAGLQVVSLHTDLGSLERDAKAVADEAKSFGTKYVVITGMYRFDYGDEATMHDLAARLNKAGEALKSEGVELLYHNHNCELRHINAEKRAYDILLEETDPQFVNFEFDSYWFTEGGANALAWMQRLGTRMKLWHINDRGTRLTGSAVTPILKTDSMELEYAKMFAVDYYQNDYALVTIADDGKYLIVPEGESVPEDMDKDITVLQQPIQNIYLAASAAMDMFVATDALDAVRFSSLKADGWYIEEAKKAMEDGDIIYAGKYSAPDYEMILNENCGLAIENTMILHTPEVKEQMEKFNIPVLVDHSSYETNPLGRTEWVKLYGLLTGHEDQAEQAFDAEAKAFEQVSDQDATGKTVAFFYITTNGEANVRKSADYLPKMIELAGGSYIFDDLGDEEEATSTVSLQMEEFYAGAKDADYIIYNSTIEGELSSMQDLLAKSPLLEKFKAVKEGHVYCTTKNLYQSTMELGTITSDIRKMLTGDDADLTYLYKVE